MAQILDLPAEILRIIVRFAIPQRLKIKLKADVSLWEVLQSSQQRNPALPIMLVNKHFRAATSVIPCTEVMVESATFMEVETFITSAGKGTRENTSFVTVHKASEIKRVRRTPQTTEKIRIARVGLDSSAKSLGHLLSKYYRNVTERERSAVWDESSAQVWLKSQWQLSGYWRRY